MKPETQRSLLDRIATHRAAGRGTDVAPSSYRVPVGDYSTPTVSTPNGRCSVGNRPSSGSRGWFPTPGRSPSLDVGGSSVIVTRGADGVVSAMLNVCRHRGAEVAAAAARRRCSPAPTTDGPTTRRLAGRPPAGRASSRTSSRRHWWRSRRSEQHGLIWVGADPDGAIDPEPLGGAEVEIAPFGLATYRLFRIAHVHAADELEARDRHVLRGVPPRQPAPSHCRP